MDKRPSHRNRVLSFLLALPLCLTLCLVQPRAQVRAQQGLAPIAHWTLPLHRPLRDLLTGDVDGDGQQEIVVVCQDGYLVVLEADGSEVWKAEHSDKVSAAGLADLDGDGHVELLIGDSRGVTAMSGDGSHMWFLRTIYTVDTLMGTDVDGDGRSEVMVATEYEHVYQLAPDGTVIWHYWPQRKGFGGSVRGLAVADFDDDGKQEVAVAFDFPGYKDMPPAGHIRFLDEDGKEVWQRRLQSPVTAIAAVDPDGWGKFLIAAGTEAGEVMVLFGDSGIRWYHELGSPVLRVLTGDVDDDQQEEIVVVTRHSLLALDDDGSVSWERNCESPVVDAALGGFEGSVGRPVALLTSQLALQGSRVDLIDMRGSTTESYPWPSAASVVRLCDLNMDGWAELLVFSSESVQLWSRARGVAHSRLVLRYSVPSAITVLDAADVTGDGRPEVLLGSQDHSLYVLNYDGWLSWRYSANGAIETLGSADVDGDGQAEVVVGYNTFGMRDDLQGGGISVLQGEGRTLWHYECDSWVWSVCSADLDGDGRQELAVGTGSNRVQVLSDAQAMWSYEAGGSVISLFAADLDGDGRAEIAAGSEDNRTYLLSGDGTLRWYDDVGQDVSAVCGADLDGDGLDEIIVGSEMGLLRALRLDRTVLWEHDVGDRPIALHAGDLNRDGHAYVAVTTSGGSICLLDASGKVVWERKLQARLLSASLGDVDGDRLTELVAGSAEGVLYIVSYGGKLEGRHELGAAVDALYVGDMDGDGRAEVLAGTRDGQLCMYKHLPNRPPLVTNPAVVHAEAGFIYSVSVSDPEGERVEVTLEVLDPFSGAWRAAGVEHAVEPGRVHWFVGPFPLLASGRMAAYRLTYSDGSNKGTIGPIPGPRAPGFPWYGYAGAAWVVGLLAWVYRGWHRSPARHARLLYTRLARDPQKALTVMRQWLSGCADPAEILIRLSNHARAAGDKVVANLAEGYLLLSSRPMAGLRILASSLGEGAAPAGDDPSRSRQLVRLYELLAELLVANSVARITVLRPTIQEMVRLLEIGVSEESAGSDDVCEAMVQLQRAAGLMHHSERVEAVDDKLDYLVQASRVLAPLLEMRRGPETNVIVQIAANWQKVIATLCEDWQGRVHLRCRLRTKRILATGEAVLVLEVQNTGRNPAIQTSVELVRDSSYKGLDAPVELGSLAPGHTRTAELRLLPLTEDPFRVEFLLRYKDRESAGKSHRFADMVEVLKPREFQFIPNPYVPGRPLGAASPLFFGREETFDFIAKNARGLRQRNILILIGQRRTGKTSMLLQLPVHLGAEYISVYLDCQSLGLTRGLPALLYDMAMTIAETLAEHELHVPVPELEALEEHAAHVFERQFLRQVEGALGNRTLLLVLDEFEELEMRVNSGYLDPTVFPYLRHLMQHTRKTAFVFVGTHRLEEMTSDYWSVLFNIALYRHIGYLDDGSARRLITAPVEPYNMVYDDLALHKMLHVTAGHPYFLQLLCYSLVNAHNESKRSYVTIADVDEALEEILTLGGAHFAFLWETSTQQERAVLIALTRLLPRRGLATWPHLGAMASDVAVLLTEHGLTMDPRETSVALRRLAGRGILREVPGDVDRYVFKVGLVALWIERYRSLSKVIEELT